MSTQYPILYIISIIRSIHQFKLSFTEYTDHKKALAECLQETNEMTVLKESELYLKMEKNASELIWDLYKLLCIAKSKFDSISADLYFSENNKIGNDTEQYNGNSQNISQEKDEGAEDSKKEDNSNKVLISKHKEIDASYVFFKHHYKPKDFISIQMQLQILLLCPGQTFAHIYKSFSDMKKLEDAINVILKENFYKDFVHETLWNQRYNKIINDCNQNLLNKEESNIFTSISRNNEILRIANAPNTNKIRRKNKNTQSLGSRSIRNRRFISVHTSFSRHSCDMDAFDSKRFNTLSLNESKNSGKLMNSKSSKINMRQNSEMIMRIEDSEMRRATTIREDEQEEDADMREETKSEDMRESIKRNREKFDESEEEEEIRT